MKMKHLHIMIREKFIENFIQFIEQNNIDEGHFYIIFGQKIEGLTEHRNIIFCSSKKVKDLLFALSLMKKSPSIYFHGLFVHPLIVLVSFYSKILSKTTWILWGNDLYAYEERNDSFSKYCYEIFRRLFIKRLGRIATSMRGEFELAVSWYSTKAKHYQAYTYPSVVYKELKCDKDNSGVRIQVGNSATISNQHISVLKYLSENLAYKATIICPLSYGDKAYAAQVIKTGNELFGSDFVPLLDMLPLEEYNRFLASIDIAIFNMNRQQGMGNIIQLLGMGKSICMVEGTSSYNHLLNLGIKIHTMEEICNFSSVTVCESNAKIISSEYNVEKLKLNLKGMFF